MTRWLVAFVCLLGVVTAGIRFFWRSPSRSGSSAADNGQAAVARMQEELAALRRAVDRSERLAGAAASVVVAARAPVTPSDPRPAETPKSPVPPAISEEEAYHRLGQLFQNETIDEKWAAGAEPNARQQVLTTLGAASTIRALECRRTTCRAAITFPNKDAYQHAMASVMLATSLAWTGTINYVPPQFEPDGSVELDEYLFRDGTNPMGDIYADGTERK
jgi:hypothetical protein